MELVEDESDIIVDILICGYDAPPTETKTGPTWKNWMQSWAVHGFNNGSNAVEEQERAYPNVDYRYYFQDQDDCHVNNYLDFNNSTTWCLQEAGRAQAKEAIEQLRLEQWEKDQVEKQERKQRSLLGKIQSFFNKN